MKNRIASFLTEVNLVCNEKFHELLEALKKKQ